MSPRINIISLGCPKNRVDAEVMIGLLQRQADCRVVGELDEADVAIVNTCGFIHDAQEESHATIAELVARKHAGALRRVIVTGCLAQRDAAALAEAFPEVDVFLGTQTFPAIGRAVAGTLDEKCFIRPGSFLMDHEVPRTNTVRGGTAYLKIAEGCSCACSFCIIPAIRGPQRSRPIADILKEAQHLGRCGVRELVLIAQDLTRYGSDLDSQPQATNLLRLLQVLDDSATAIDWIRLLYLYPWNLSDALLSLIAQAQRILRYLDLPLQHIDDRILKAMRRNVRAADQRQLVDKLRAIDGMVLRTTFLVGFPGETDQAFRALYDWMAEVAFDHVGVFAFSPEVGTPAATFPDQVEPHLREERRQALMTLQAEISARRNQQWIGRVTPIIVDGVSEEHALVLEGRHYGQAPEIDGVTYLSFDDDSGDLPHPGDIVTVQITQATTYDLAGTVLPAADDAQVAKLGGTAHARR